MLSGQFKCPDLSKLAAVFRAQPQLQRPVQRKYDILRLKHCVFQILCIFLHRQFRNDPFFTTYLEHYVACLVSCQPCRLSEISGIRSQSDRRFSAPNFRSIFGRNKASVRLDHRNCIEFSVQIFHWLISAIRNIPDSEKRRIGGGRSKAGVVNAISTPSSSALRHA